jgi:hypothetical protein
MEKQYSDMLLKSLVDMPDLFSSVQLGRSARKQGFPQILVSTGKLNAWLTERCDNQSKFMWAKRKAAPTTPTPAPDDVFLEECIKYLKERGYKVQKQVFVDC